MNDMRKKDWFVLAGWLLLCQAAAALGSWVTLPSIPTWYASLHKPELAPPNWVFGPVWTTLFVLMAVAAFVVWKKGKDRHRVRVGLALFFAQLLLNVLWSVVFFGLHQLGTAVLEVAVFWLSIAATIWAFAKVSKTAAWLMSPYLGWVSFASYLTFAIWMLNR